jgi:hypothetical protein
MLGVVVLIDVAPLRRPWVDILTIDKKGLARLKKTQG